jgi:hypothetical protein
MRSFPDFEHVPDREPETGEYVTAVESVIGAKQGRFSRCRLDAHGKNTSFTHSRILHAHAGTVNA